MVHSPSMNNRWPVIAKLAKDLGRSPDWIRKAKHRRHVPYRWRQPILTLAKKRRIRGLRYEDFDAAPKGAA